MKNIVSIVVPVFNTSPYLDRTLYSLVSQKYSNYEIILIDDGSTDSSGEKCDYWAEKDKRITVIHTSNAGPSAARNSGILIAKGNYILPVDSDDVIDESYIEKAAKILDCDKKVGIVYCRATLFGNMSGSWSIPKFSIPEMLVSNCIFSSAMFRKKDWEIVGGYSTELRYGLEDYDFWLSILSLGRRVFQIPEALFWYRKHIGSRSDVFEKDSLIVEKTNNQIFDRHIDLYERFYCIPQEGVISVIYGAGGACKSYIRYLKSIRKLSTIKYCVDENYKNIIWQEDLRLESPSILWENKNNDIVIALNNVTVYQDIEERLLEYGYSINQIHWYINNNELEAYSVGFEKQEQLNE